MVKQWVSGWESQSGSDSENGRVEVKLRRIKQSPEFMPGAVIRV